jgi:competence ComEA-like helix-hairpin-helix protein
VTPVCRNTLSMNHRSAGGPLTPTLSPSEGERENRRQRSSVLIGLLWCLALLSVVVIGVLHTARMDLLVVKNYGDRIQARYLALAGVEKAKALLYQDARERTRSSRHHSGELYDAPDHFRDVTFGRGQFRVFRPGQEEEGGGVIYGVSDEESRLNVNVASAEELGKLDGMTPDVVAAIVDWRDADNQVTPGGAEWEYYASLGPPYQPRNGPFQTIRELLMVRGVSTQLLGGNDAQLNGLPGSPADSSDGNPPGVVNTGWADFLTVDSSVKDVSATGGDRVNVQTAEERSLTAIRGITSDIARSIVAYRGQHRLESIADLLEVTAAQNQNQNQLNTTSSANSRGRNQSAPPPTPQSSSNSSGAKVVSDKLLMEIADDVTARSDADLAGAININTARLEVLACLPGVSPELAQAIISFRQSSGFFPNIAWLLKVPGMSSDIFKRVAPLVSARSETFRIISEGRINSSGVRQRIQEIVHIGLHDITTVSYREDNL